MKIFNKDFYIDLHKSILWQYDKATKLKSLIIQKETWINENVRDFIVGLYNNIFNIETANDFGLTIWGKLLNLSRYVRYATGVEHYLSTEEYRFLLKSQMLRFRCNGTIPQINKFLHNLFDDEKQQCYCIDNKDMSITYVIQKDLSDKQWLIHWLIDPAQRYIDWLPRPAGVQILISTGYQGYFAFEGSGIEGFDNGILVN